MGNIIASEMSDNTTPVSGNNTRITIEEINTTQGSTNTTQTLQLVSDVTEMAERKQIEKSQDSSNPKHTVVDGNQELSASCSTIEESTSTNKSQEDSVLKMVGINSNSTRLDSNSVSESSNAASKLTNRMESRAVLETSTSHSEIQEEPARELTNAATTEYFKLDMEKRHEKRRQLIAEKRKEMMTLREELERYKQENEELKRCDLVKQLEVYKSENKELKRKLVDVIAIRGASSCNDVDNKDYGKNSCNDVGSRNHCCKNEDNKNHGENSCNKVNNKDHGENSCNAVDSRDCGVNSCNGEDCTGRLVQMDKTSPKEFINKDYVLVKQENARIMNELEQCKKENECIKNELRDKTDKLTELDKLKQQNEETNSKLRNITQVNLGLLKQLSEANVELLRVKTEKEDLMKEKNTIDSQLAEVENLKKQNGDLVFEVESLKMEIKRCEALAEKNNQLRISLSQMQSELQELNAEFLNIEQERTEYAKHIGALKDVIRVTKEMLHIRESQIEELKGKVKTVEEILASKEMKIMSDGLREEYEKQLRNIRNLRNLYEERQRLDKRDKENLQEQLDECKKQIEDEQKKNSELQERVIELEKDNSLKYDTINSLQSNLGLSKAECKDLQAEINIINQLFSEILLGFKNTQEIDLDKLVKMLEENHDLLTNMATNEESNSTSAALPKLLLDLINQVNKEDEAICCENTETACQASNQLNSAEEIVETLPKVWKVLMELLSHQNPPLNALFGACQEEPCYKLIETSKGAKLKLSVSQTFIRLKDLILEKKFLEKETYRLKHLNTHLEGRLQDQEARLELVSSEVKNTWHVVDKMQRQHQQLHTHETVLRYELQQKRKLLNELKQDLQYCREKWVEARAKNDTTHSQWKELRKEFADRKNKGGDDFNQSAESGYSDGKDSSEDERGYESDVSEGKHETDAENEFGEQKTESEEFDEKRQLVQNECCSVSCFDESQSAVVEIGEEIGVVIDDNEPLEYVNESREEIISGNEEGAEAIIEETNKEVLPDTNEIDSNIIIDSEIQELFDEMCKFVERGNESSSNNSPNLEITEEEMLARKQRLQRLEEEFKEVTEFDLKDIIKDENNKSEEYNTDLHTEMKHVTKVDPTSDNVQLETKESMGINNAGCETDTKAFNIQENPHNSNTDLNAKIDLHNSEARAFNIHDNSYNSNIDLSATIEPQDLEVQAVNIQDNSHNSNTDLNASIEPKDPEAQAFNIQDNSNNNNTDLNATIELQDLEAQAFNIQDNSHNNNTDLNATIEPQDSEAPIIQSKALSTEEILKRREERLQRLETQSQLLLTKTRKTTKLSNVICEKLDVLHGMYGETNEGNDAGCTRRQREILIRREARLRKLEIQCKALLARVMKKSAMKIHKDCEEISERKEENQGGIKSEEKENHNINNTSVEQNNANIIDAQKEINTIKDEDKQQCVNEEITRLSEITSNSKEKITSRVNKTDDINKQNPCSIQISPIDCSGTESDFLQLENNLKSNEENLAKIQKRSRYLLTSIKDSRQRKVNEIAEEVASLLQELITTIDKEVSLLTILYERFMNNQIQMQDEASSVGISETFLDAREARFTNAGETFIDIVNEICN